MSIGDLLETIESLFGKKGNYSIDFEGHSQYKLFTGICIGFLYSFIWHFLSFSDSEKRDLLVLDFFGKSYRPVIKCDSQIFDWRFSIGDSKIEKSKPPIQQFSLRAQKLQKELNVDCQILSSESNVLESFTEDSSENPFNKLFVEDSPPKRSSRIIQWDCIGIQRVKDDFPFLSLPEGFGWFSMDLYFILLSIFVSPQVLHPLKSLYLLQISQLQEL
jgi:hypothetical protein